MIGTSCDIKVETNVINYRIIGALIYVPYNKSGKDGHYAFVEERSTGFVGYRCAVVAS